MTDSLGTTARGNYRFKIEQLRTPNKRSQYSENSNNHQDNYSSWDDASGRGIFLVNDSVGGSMSSNGTWDEDMNVPTCCEQIRTPWALYMIFTTLAFTASNISICRLTSYGPTGIFYFSSGNVLCGLIYLIYDAVMLFKKRGRTVLRARNRRNTFCSNMCTSIYKEDGTCDVVNILAFISFCLVYQINQMFAFLTLYYA